MNVQETHETSILIEPGDTVRDLCAVLDSMPNGAQIRANSTHHSSSLGMLTINHLNLKGNN